MIKIYKVASVTKKIQGALQKAHANDAWQGVIDVVGTATNVILKQEAPHRLVKELLAVDLADRLGVPHITGWAASVDQATMQAYNIASTIPDPSDPARRLLFASELSHGNPIAASAGSINAAARQKYFQHPSAVSILVFDELIGNYDRQYENIMEEGGDFKAFDHDKIFFGDKPIWAPLPGAASQPLMCTVSDEVGIFAANTKATASNLAASWAGRLTSPIPILQDLVSANLLTSTDEQAIETYLIDRLLHLSGLVEQHYP